MILAANQLFSKESKCHFGVQQVKYLGHSINKDGVSVDLEKSSGGLAHTHYSQGSSRIPRLSRILQEIHLSL
jgi:hypothetical protein